MEFYRKGEQHLIENYDKAKKDNFKGWCIHHRLELTLDGEFAHTPNELIRLGMYYNRPYFELIYLKNSEHTRLHNKSRIISQETKDKISKSVKKAYDDGRLNTKGENNGMYHKTGYTPWNKGKVFVKKKTTKYTGKGKGHHDVSDEARKKISEAKKEYWKTHSIPKEQQNKMAQSRKGKKRGQYKLSYSTWYIDGNGKRVYVK